MTVYELTAADWTVMITLLDAYDNAADQYKGGCAEWPGSISSDRRLQDLADRGLLVARNVGIANHRAYRLQCPPLHAAMVGGSEWPVQAHKVQAAGGGVFLMTNSLFARYTDRLAKLLGPGYSAERVASDLAHIGADDGYDFKNWTPSAQYQAMQGIGTPDELRLRSKALLVVGALALLKEELPQLFAQVENFDLRKDPCLPQVQESLETLYLLSRKYAHKEF